MKPRAALLATLVLLGAVGAAQEPRWFLYTDGSLLFNVSALPAPLSWDDAAAACDQRRSYILWVDSREDWDFVAPRLLAIWRAHFPNVDPSWGAPGCFFLHANYRTNGDDAAWLNGWGVNLPDTGFLAPWNEPWAACAGASCPKGHEPNDAGRRCAVFGFGAGTCDRAQFAAATRISLSDATFDGPAAWCQARRPVFCRWQFSRG